MEQYHKINALFKRHTEGPNKGKLIIDDFAQPEFDYLRHNVWEWTEKVDGTNVRIWWGYEAGSRYKCVKFGGRTDRAVMPIPLMEHLTSTFTTELFEQSFPEASSNPITLYGEGYGENIQNGGSYRSDQSFILFDVKINTWWLKREDVVDVAQKMGIETVPIVGEGNLYEAIDWVATGMPSFIGRNLDAEGLIAVPKVPLASRNGSRIITKIKGVDFR